MTNTGEKRKTRFYIPKSWRLPAVLTAVLLVLILVCVIYILTDGGPEPNSSLEQMGVNTAPVENLEESGIPTWENVPETSLDFELFTWENGAAVYPGAALGVDVSSHQGEIDWQQVKDSGVEFAIVQLGYRGYTQGGLYEDELFRRNYRGAKDAGLQVGVYFFSQAVTEQEALEEAQFVVNALDGLTIDLPVYFDWENITDDTARTDTVEESMLTAFARVFCNEIIAADHTPGLYFNLRQGYGVYDMDSLSDCVFWLAEYDGAPSYAYHTDMWQFTAAGTVPGITTQVDLNLMF